VMGHILSRMCQVPLVTTCHGYFKVRYSRKWAPCWGDRVIAISKAVCDHLLKDFLVRPENVVCIQSGIDLDKFTLVNREVKSKNRADMKLNDVPTLGMIARLSDVKGQDILINAMPKIVEKCRNVKLIFVGEGREESSLKKRVEELKLHDHVEFHPVVQQTFKYLSVFDVFVSPSRNEGLGLAVMEAQAAGLPVVASNVGGLKNLIDSGKTGILVERANERALSDAIIKILRNPSLATEIGLAARRVAEREYSSEIMVDKILSVYRDLFLNK